MRLLLILIIILGFCPAFGNISIRFKIKLQPTKQELILKMFNAFWKVEASNKIHAHNINEDAVGCVQIRPIMFKELNNLYPNKFKLSDRWSKYKSIEMFSLLILHHVPSLDLKLAANFWNCGHINKHNPKYWMKIKAAYGVKSL
jgi:hypothetical protein